MSTSDDKRPGDRASSKPGNRNVNAVGKEKEVEKAVGKGTVESVGQTLLSPPRHSLRPQKKSKAASDSSSNAVRKAQTSSSSSSSSLGLRGSAGGVRDRDSKDRSRHSGRDARRLRDGFPMSRRGGRGFGTTSVRSVSNNRDNREKREERDQNGDARESRDRDAREKRVNRSHHHGNHHDQSSEWASENQSSRSNRDNHRHNRNRHNEDSYHKNSNYDDDRFRDGDDAGDEVVSKVYVVNSIHEALEAGSDNDSEKNETGDGKGKECNANAPTMEEYNEWCRKMTALSLSPAPEASHPLTHSWTFWFDRRIVKTQEYKNNYGSNLKPFATVDTVSRWNFGFDVHVHMLMMRCVTTLR